MRLPSIKFLGNSVINRLKYINAEFEKMYGNYYTYEWAWAYEKLEDHGQ